MLISERKLTSQVSNIQAVRNKQRVYSSDLNRTIANQTSYLGSLSAIST